MEIDLSSWLLKDRVTEQQYNAIREATAFRRNEAALGPTTIEDAVDNQVFGRHDKFIRFLLPWMMQNIDLKQRRIIEIGGGTGSSALAASYFCQSVLSIEIDADAVEAYAVRKQTFEVDNMSAVHCAPEAVVDTLEAHWQPGDVIMLIAVVEHLLESERLEYLQRIWQLMQPGDFFVIAGTPNRFAYTDRHTTNLPFIHLLSNEVYFEYMQQHRNEPIRLANAVMQEFDNHGWKQGVERRYRDGMGASYHDFLNAFQVDLNTVVISDGFEKPITGWHPYTIDDKSLVTYFDGMNLDVPAGFARGVLNFIFQKPASPEAAEQQSQENRTRNRRILNQHSLTRVVDRLANRVKTLEERVKQLESESNV